MRDVVPLTRDLVLIGGGHAHALVLRAWGMDPLAGARVTVINPGPTAPYTGMLPGHVAGHYGRDDLEIDLVRLCRHAGARLILDKAVGIDRGARQVLLQGRGPVGYDVASVDVGITAEMDLPGFAAHGIGAKPLDVFADRWRGFLAQVDAGQAAPQVAVIGGGVAGCELAMAMAHRLAAAGHIPQVSVIEAGPDITGMGARAKVQVKAAMAALGIVLRTGVRVVSVGPAEVSLAEGAPVPAALCVGAAGAFPHGWIAQTDVPQLDGFITVGRDLGVLGCDDLFAVGDCAVMPADPRPKAGVFAVRAAPILHDNLRAALSGGTRRLWHPQKDYLKLVSLGGKAALAEKFGLVLKGPAMWRWKDRIDRAFMDRLNDLPAMKVPALPADMAQGVQQMVQAKPLCGGCGAKVGLGVLRAAVPAVGTEGGDILSGPGDDAAILRQPGGGYQVISTDHLRAFTLDPAVMARIAAVHALGDVWAMGAKPQAALATLILPQMSAALQRRTLDEIMAAAGAVIRDAGAEIIGGHTTMGAELTIGFTVTGTRDRMPITVSGARAGDVLVLTRPIGAGVLLAAEMAGQADGRDVATALAQMAAPQGAAAAALAEVAHAMTDVTGFGLAGHIRAMLGSDLDAALQGDAIPVYAGAEALSAAGVSSVLMASNQADAPVVGAEMPLLHDPQTAGGLLAAVPQKAVAEVLVALEAAGGQGHVIGQLSAGSGQIVVT